MRVPQKISIDCDKCGACCRHLKLFGEMYAWLVDGGTGMCRYFDPHTNLCTIYPIRPLICNIDEGYRLFFSHIPYEEFIEKNRHACIMLKNFSPNTEQP